VAAVGAFLFLAILQWGVPFTGVDGVHYITGGLSLIREARFVNPSGGPELWFPPLYPLAIGIGSVAGTFDPVIVARLISLGASGLTIVLVWIACRRIVPDSELFAGLTVAALAVNPLFARQALAVLAEATATALMVLAFVVWLRSANSVGRTALVGALTGLSYLTRPEALIPFAIWTAVDGFRRRQVRTVMCYAAAWLTFFAVAAPYIGYLYRHTNQLTISNKLQITLASGRATYYGCPREYIDPARLDMRLGASA
jgi:hypothetical protein